MAESPLPDEAFKEEIPINESSTDVVVVDAEAPKPESQLSISERLCRESSQHLRPPPRFIRWIEVPFRFTIKLENGTTVLKEAVAWGMDSLALGLVHQAGSYVASTIIILASEDAGCPSKDVCDKNVYGVRPSSLLSVGVIVVGVFSALFLPIFGAVVDHTSHRKITGVISAVLLCMILALQLMISLETWFFIFIIECIGGFILLIHTTTSMAYLPEFATNDEQTYHYNSRFTVIKYIGMPIYLLSVTGISRAAKAEPTTTARVALGLALGASGILFSYSWIYLFQKRPALSKIPEGTSLISCGFMKVGKTSHLIFTKYRSLFWFMTSLLVAPDAGSGVLASIAISFMTSFLKMTPLQVGIAAVSMLISTVLGSVLYKCLSQKIDPLMLFRCGLMALLLSVGLTSIVIATPEQTIRIYPCAVLWGISWGLLYTGQRVLYCTIAPKGQQTEIMGLFAFVNLIIGWLPALLFVLLNERNVNMRLSISVLSLFLFFSLCFTSFIGSYEDAVAQVNKQVEDKSDFSDSKE